MRELLASIAVEAALAAGIFALVIYLGYWMGPAYYAAALGGILVLIIQMAVRAGRDIAACQRARRMKSVARWAWRGRGGRA